MRRFILSLMVLLGVAQVLPANAATIRFDVNITSGEHDGQQGQLYLRYFDFASVIGPFHSFDETDGTYFYQSEFDIIEDVELYVDDARVFDLYRPSEYWEPGDLSDIIGIFRDGAGVDEVLFTAQNVFEDNQSGLSATIAFSFADLLSTASLEEVVAQLGDVTVNELMERMSGAEVVSPVQASIGSSRSELVSFVNGQTTRITFDVVGAEITTIPLPAALPLMATGVAGLGLMGWRKRKTA